MRESLDPLDQNLLPQGARLILDYRTEPGGAPAARSAAKRTLVFIALVCFLTVLVARTMAAPLYAKEGVLQGLFLFFWCVLFPVLGIIVVIKYIRGRDKPHLIGWLVVPVLIWAVLHVTAAGFDAYSAYFVLFLPTLMFATWVCDRIAFV